MKRFAGLRRRVAADFGATSVEYALMLVCIAAAVVGGATLLGVSANSWLLTPLAGF